MAKPSVKQLPFNTSLSSASTWKDAETPTDPLSKDEKGPPCARPLVGAVGTQLNETKLSGLKDPVAQLEEISAPPTAPQRALTG